MKNLVFDEIKSLLRLLESFAETFLLSVIYYLIWKGFYFDFVLHISQKRELILFCVYFILIALIFYFCDCYKFGHLKLTDIFVSQTISILIVNFVTYFQLCLVSSKALNVLPMLLLTILQILLSFALSFLFTDFYHRNNNPRSMLLIYGNDNGVNIKFKLDTRKDIYNVNKLISVNAGLDNIHKEIDKHDAVIISDVPSNERNDILKYCYQKEVRTYVVPKISDIVLRGAESITLFDTPLLLVKGKGLSLSQKIVKRLMDIVLSFIALVIASPIMLVVAIAIKLEEPGGVQYSSNKKERQLTEKNLIF